MKITYKNYPKEIQKINWSALPKNLKDLKEDMQEFYELYNDDATIKETFDLFLKRLNEHLLGKTPVKKEKECKEPTVKQPRNTKKSRSTTKPKATRKRRLSLPQVNITEVDFYKDEYRLLRRFYNMITKKQAVTFRSIQLLYMAFQKTAVSRKVRKTAGSADLFNTCNEKLAKLFQSTATSKETVKINFSDKKLLKKLELFVKGQKIDTAISLIGRVINLQGTAPEEAKVKRLITSIDNAIEKDKVSKNNRLYKELIKCKKDLNAYLKGSSKRIALKPHGLTGARKKKVVTPANVVQLESRVLKAVDYVSIPATVQPKGKGKRKQKPAEPLRNSKYKTSYEKLNEQQVITEVFQIKDHNWSTFLGGIERKPKQSLIITLDSEAGGGKTHTAYQFADAMASSGYRPIIWSLEEHADSKLSRDKQEKYFSVATQKMIVVESENNELTSEEKFNAIVESIHDFDVIIIDSWAKILELNHKAKIDKDFRKKFDGKLFFIINQRTQDGKMRGGADVAYDGDIILKVYVDPDKDFKKNYIYNDKNRYNEYQPLHELKYSPYYRTLVGEPENILQLA